jgi:hypothetical protein
MPLSRLLFLIIGLSLIVGLLLWLIASLSRLYSEIAWTSPFLAGLLVFVLIVFLLVLIGILLYYLLFPSLKDSGKKRRTPKLGIKVPSQKSEAASYSLKAVRQQLTQIEDQVAKEALYSKSKEIEANLFRGDLQVVVFGTGSAGKTSLVNALIGEIVGDVDATMGTTQTGESYRLKLQGLEREILIFDTPGILEAGSGGENRGELARELATRADLLLFVVDNDLRQSEYEPLRALAEIGKRSLLVFNKGDLYSDDDRELILSQLRERVKGFIAPADVVVIAANPQPVEFSSGEILEPQPEIMPLIKRLAAVIRAEGDELLADNILLQSQRLGEEARKIIDHQRRRQADQVITRYQWIGAGVIAVTPLPVVDMLATAAVNAQMVVEIGQVYNCELDSAKGKELALSLGKTLVSLGIVKGAVELLAKVLQLNVTTYVLGKIIQGVTAAYLTRIAGKSFVEYFRADQDWGDGGITEVVQRQFKLSRKDEFIRAFVKDAIAQVIRPISDSLDQDIEEILEQENPQSPGSYDDDWSQSDSGYRDDEW